MSLIPAKNKGVSLPLVVGLVSLLMIASVSTSELILRAVKSAHNVEAADRAYFAAEAGIENALYELAPHYAGYETPPLTDADNVRKDALFGSGGVKWENNWSVSSRTTPPLQPPYSDKLLAKQKLIVSLFNDVSGDDAVIDENKINDATLEVPDIVTFNPADLTITFRVPFDEDGDYSNAFKNGPIVPSLTIDNDGDAGNSIKDNGINEDSALDSAICNNLTGKDSDCDGREDEDSPEDPVIYWKISDDQGNSLIPIKGCLGDEAPLPTGGSQICEKNFQSIDEYLSVKLDVNTTGINQSGETKTIGGFLTDVNPPNFQNNKLQVEFFTVAPMEQAYLEGPTVKKQPIPYFEYTVTSGEASMPLPFFTIKSDGYYQDFKQSITTTVMPKTSAPLFDFTIIQQQ